jgi:TIR domain
MALLHEYFVKDGSSNLTTQRVWPLQNADGSKIGEITARLHYDFEAYAKFVSFYIPAMDGVTCPEALALNELPEILKWPNEVLVQSGIGAEATDGRELVFTGRIYIYSERPVAEEHMKRTIAESKQQGHSLIFRSTEYMTERNKWEKPRAFISHDSRDKAAIAEPLALQLLRFMCPVWYDDFSLKVGDSLRGKIEQGLKECPKCILILTPNFLSNEGWSRKEYDSIFTRELVEQRQVILPVWNGVSAQDVYKYSPILADRVGVQWSKGVEEVARRLLKAMNSGAA